MTKQLMYVSFCLVVVAIVNFVIDLGSDDLSLSSAIINLLVALSLPACGFIGVKDKNVTCIQVFVCVGGGVCGSLVFVDKSRHSLGCAGLRDFKLCSCPMSLSKQKEPPCFYATFDLLDTAKHPATCCLPCHHLSCFLLVVSSVLLLLHLPLRLSDLHLDDQHGGPPRGGKR